MERGIPLLPYALPSIPAQSYKIKPSWLPMKYCIIPRTK